MFRAISVQTGLHQSKVISVLSHTNLATVKGLFLSSPKSGWTKADFGCENTSVCFFN